MKTFLSCFLAAVLMTGCSDSPTSESTVTITDAQLYLWATTTVKAAFYKNSSDTIPGNSGSAHAGKILVWYNAKAKNQLDAQGKVKADPVFPDSSLIVKEIFSTSGERLYYAIMFKLSTAANKGPGDWVWAELEPDGDPAISARDKGTGCAGCHSAGVGYTRMNDSHP